MEPTTSPLLTLEETAAMLRRTPSQLRYLIHSKQAPASGVIGGRRMFRRADVEAFIAAAFKESESASVA